MTTFLLLMMASMYNPDLSMSKSFPFHGKALPPPSPPSSLLTHIAFPEAPPFASARVYPIAPRPHHDTHARTYTHTQPPPRALSSHEVLVFGGMVRLIIGEPTVRGPTRTCEARTRWE